VLRNVLTSLANTLRDQGEIDERESFIDVTFASAKGCGADIGKTKRGKGVKIMGIVDRNGFPLAVCTHSANHHEVTLVQLTFDFYMIEAKPEKLIGDKAYDSDDLDNDLGKQGIDMIAPRKSNRVKESTQDGRKLRRYKRRWIVERFFAWLQWHRRLLVGWEYYAENFLGLVKLASICILLKRF
jgi:transposase